MSIRDWHVFDVLNRESGAVEPRWYRTRGKANAAAKGLRKRYWYYETQIAELDGQFIVQYRQRQTSRQQNGEE